MRVVQQPQRLGLQAPSDERRVAGTTRADDDAELQIAVEGATLLQRQAE